MPQTIQFKDIRDAQARLLGHIHKTPVLTSSLLNHWLGHEIFFKAECLQKTGAFKARGACNTLAYLVENQMKPKHIVANSSGNHSQAVAWAAARFGIPATIYMPNTASSIKIQATRAYGANIDLCETRKMVDEGVLKAAKLEGHYWIPPFNHPLVMAGQGTAALDALDELGDIDAVFASCGGGGLLSGTLVATRGAQARAKVMGVEPLNANDAAQSLRNNSIFSFETTPKSIADGAMTLSVGELTFELLKQLDDFYEIPENRIIYWTQWLNHLLKVRIEPTSAMAMDGVHQWLKTQTSKKRVLVILTGGNIDQACMNKIYETDYTTELPGL